MRSGKSCAVLLLIVAAGGCSTAPGNVAGPSAAASSNVTFRPAGRVIEAVLQRGDGTEAVPDRYFVSLTWKDETAGSVTVPFEGGIARLPLTQLYLNPQKPDRNIVDVLDRQTARIIWSGFVPLGVLFAQDPQLLGVARQVGGRPEPDAAPTVWEMYTKDAEKRAARVRQQREQCERLAYNSPAFMIPKSYGDIPRSCSNGWVPGTADYAKCLQRFQECWRILESE